MSLLTSCASVTQREVASLGSNSATSQASSNDGPLRVILIGPKNDVLARIQLLAGKNCVVHGFRGTESLEKSNRESRGLGFDVDRNSFIDDKYGWQFGPDKFSAPIFSLKSELGLAGDWKMFGKDYDETTGCTVVFPIFLEDNSLLQDAVNYIGISDVLYAYLGPVEVHHAPSFSLRRAILKMLSPFARGRLRIVGNLG